MNIEIPPRDGHRDYLGLGVDEAQVLGVHRLLGEEEEHL